MKVLGVILCLIVVLVGFIIVTDKIEAREMIEAQRQTEAREAREAAATARTERRRIAEEKKAEKARLLAEQKAEKARLLAEQKALEEANRIKTIPARLKLAQEEYQKANLEYESLLPTVEESRVYIAKKEIRMTAAMKKADALDKQAGIAKDTKNRAEGQYRSTRRDSGARKKSPTDERKASRNYTRGMIKKAGAARALAEKEQINYNLRKQKLTVLEAQLTSALAKLNSKKEILDKVQNENRRN